MTKTLVTDNGKTTWFTDGIKKVVVKVYDGCKYNPDSKKIAEIEYEITGFGIYNGSDIDADEYDDIVNNDMVDEYDEYLKIWMSDDDTATFRNSNVEMFLR